MFKGWGTAGTIMLLSLVLAPLFFSHAHAASLEARPELEVDFQFHVDYAGPTSNDLIFSWNRKNKPSGNILTVLSYGIEFYTPQTADEKLSLTKCKANDNTWKRVGRDHKVLEDNKTTGDIKWQIKDLRKDIPAESFFRLVHVNMFGYRSTFAALSCDTNLIKPAGYNVLDPILVNFVSQPSGAKVTVQGVTGARTSAEDICVVWKCTEGTGTTPTKVTLTPFTEAKDAVITFTHPKFGAKTVTQRAFTTNNMQVKAIFDDTPDTVAISVNSQPDQGMVVTIDGHAPTSADGGKTATNLVMHPPRDTASPPKSHTLVLKDPASGKTKTATVTFANDETITWDIATDTVTKESDGDVDDENDNTGTTDTSQYGTYENCTQKYLAFAFGEFSMGKWIACNLSNGILAAADLITKYAPNVPL